MTQYWTHPKTALVYADELSQYKLSPEHPLRPIRLQHMHELMRASGLLDLENVASPAPRIATKQEIETSHDPDAKGHRDLYREQIDLPVLKSVLYDYEDLLLHDGCTGLIPAVAVAI